MNTFAAPAQADLESFLNRLERVRPVGPDRWLACCPAHEDHRPSLDLRLAHDGKILLVCRVGCAAHDILRALGLDWPALFPDRPSPAAPQRRPLSDLERAQREALRRVRRGAERARARAGIDRCSDAIFQYHRAGVEWRALGHQLGPDHEGAWALLELAASFETRAANLEAALEDLRLERIA